MSIKLLVVTALLISNTITNCVLAQETPGVDKQVIEFGIVPQQAASKLAKLWGPILSYLENETGYKYIFRTAKNIPEFEKRLVDGKYDIAYMNPYHYTVFHDNPGYEAIAKQQDKHIKGIVVTRKDSSMKSITDLHNNTLAFPAPAAFAASVLPRAYMRNNKIEITPSYVSSHDSVYRSVAKGLYPAGGGIQRTFNNVDPSIRNQLKVLWTTKPFTPHAIAIHPRINKKVKERIQQALITMKDNPEGKLLLANIKFKGIESAHNRDWDDVRNLDINILNQLVSN